MASAILTAISARATANPISEYWYRDVAQIVQLLRGSPAETMLPRSWGLATGPCLTSIIPNAVAPETLDILMMVSTTEYGTHQQVPTDWDDTSLCYCVASANHLTIQLSSSPEGCPLRMRRKVFMMTLSPSNRRPLARACSSQMKRAQVV
ncbi:hypothetical protein B0H11DRAFT_314157 [Mycena galericulata]|nr:hypothetical protein B0H11DRAFT_314157 [Mycena galericulata]